MSTLSPDDVRKVAKLARLQLSEQEQAKYAEQLQQILGYVELLNEVETADVEPLAHTTELTNVLRLDIPRESLSREAALSNAPKQDGKYFLVPQIIKGA